MAIRSTILGCTALAAAVLSGPALAAPVDGANILLNHSFEAGTSGWQLVNSSIYTDSLYNPSPNPQDGNRYWLSSPYQEEASASQTVDLVTEGFDVFRLKSSGYFARYGGYKLGTNSKISLTQMDAAGNNLGESNLGITGTNGSWASQSGDVTTLAPGTAKLEFKMTKTLNFNPAALDNTHLQLHQYDIWIGGDTNQTAQLNADWNLTGTGNFTIGDSGAGQLGVSNGRTLANTLTSVVNIGAQAGSHGEVEVSGANSIWSNSNGLYLGQSGTGVLTVKEGGALSNTWSHIGRSSTGDGTATVTGTDSTWSNSSVLHVGSSGTGKLSVADGGRVTSSAGYIGWEAGGDGEVTVAGADINGNKSTWTTSGSLYVGGSATAAGGTGTLTVGTGGVVDVKETLKLWDQGTVTLTGGELKAKTVELNGKSIDGNGTITTTQGLDLGGGELAGDATGLDLHGDLHGSGTVTNTTLHGGVHVGNSPGIITMNDVDFSSTSTLFMELAGNGGVAGTDFDQIIFTGDILDLTDVGLEVTFFGGFMAEAGDSFQLFDFSGVNSVIDPFQALLLPDFTNADLEWDISTLYSDGTLGVNVSAVPLPAAVWLFGSALLGLVAFRRRSNKLS
ncbi:MAG: VPLPA-CTERM sorting domain-containing protein [Sedimenticola sp.]